MGTEQITHTHKSHASPFGSIIVAQPYILVTTNMLCFIHTILKGLILSILQMCTPLMLLFFSEFQSPKKILAATSVRLLGQL